MLKKLILDESGMEMIEWTIVATVFAVAAAAFWNQLGGAIDQALQTTAATVSAGASGS